MTRIRRLTGMLWIPAVLVVLAGCSDQPLSADGRLISVAAQMDIVSGDAQTGLVGKQLPEPLVVAVKDTNGNPVEGQVINFVVTEGGGRVFAGAAVSNSSGVVQEWWTLGTNPGTNRVEARAVDAKTGNKLVFGVLTAEGVTSLSTPEDTVPPAMPGKPQLTTAWISADSFAVEATWSGVSDAAYYYYDSGPNSGSWRANGNTKQTAASFRAPRIVDMQYWICVWAVDAAGNKSPEANCNTYHAPAESTGTVSTVTVSPASATIQVGGTVQLAATMKDANGNTLSGNAVTWTSSNMGVATVTSSGLVTAVAAGSATVTATSDNVSGTAAISVTTTGGSSSALVSHGFEDGSLGQFNYTGGWPSGTGQTGGYSVVNQSVGGRSGNFVRLHYQWLNGSAGQSAHQSLVWTPGAGQPGHLTYGKTVWSKADIYIPTPSQAARLNDNRKLFDWFENGGASTRMTLHRRYDAGVGHNLRYSFVRDGNEVAFGTTGVILDYDKWYTIETRVTTNSAAGVADGVLEIYVNGESSPSFKKTDCYWLSSNTSNLGKFFIGFQITQAAGSSGHIDEYRYYDNVAFGTQRVTP